MLQIVTIRLSYKLQWPEQRLVVNESADWGVQGEINISPDNIEVRANSLHSVQDNGTQTSSGFIKVLFIHFFVFFYEETTR